MTDGEYLSLAISIGFLNIDKLRNKHIGCIIVKDDRIISVGFRSMFPQYHGYKYGCLHGEYLCLKSIELVDVKDAVIYSTMSPCTNRILDDRLYPFKSCCDYIIESGKIGKVIYATEDPWIGGGGAKLLNAAGIETLHIPVDVPFVQDVIPEEFRELIEPFLEKSCLVTN